MTVPAAIPTRPGSSTPRAFKTRKARPSTTSAPALRSPIRTGQLSSTMPRAPSSIKMGQSSVMQRYSSIMEQLTMRRHSMYPTLVLSPALAPMFRRLGERRRSMEVSRNPALLSLGEASRKLVRRRSRAIRPIVAPSSLNRVFSPPKERLRTTTR